MTGRQDIFQQAMNQGHSAAWDQLWERAAKYYRQALREIPDHPQALINLGLALYELQEYEEALSCYQSAAKALPNDPLPIEKMAQLFERLGKLRQASQTSLQAAELYLKNRDANKAIDNWLRVTRLSPENLLAHSRLALVYEKLGQKQKAVTEYLAVASLLQKNGDMDKAIKAVNQALKVIPNNDEAIQALALLRDLKPLPRPTRPRGGTAPLRMAQVRQLEAPHPDAQAESGSDPIAQARQKALTVLAGMLFEGKEEDRSDQGRRIGLNSIMRGTGVLPKAMDRSRIVLHLSQVVDLQTHEKYDQASVELERAIEAGLDHAAAFYDLGFLYSQTDKIENAISNLQNAIQHGDFALGSHLLLADIMRKQDRMQEASVEYLEALKVADSMVVRPEQADDLRQLYEPLLEAQWQQTDPLALERLCDNIKELLMRSDWRAHLTRARQQLPIQDQNRPPIPLAEIITEARSSQVVESISKIYELADHGKLHSAMEETYYAMQHSPTYLPLHTYLGELMLRDGQLQEGVSKFMMVARTYSARGETQRAIDLYRRIIDLAPMDLNARSRLIEHLVTHDQIEEAIKEYLNMADVYYNQADLDMARRTYTEALRLAQQSKVDRSWRVRVLYSMADIDLQSLDWRQALRIFEQIRTLQPDEEKARSNLIELNFRLGQEALALGELDNYIAYLASVDQRDKAAVFLENLLNENPERISVRLRLAELYRQTGHMKEAIQQYDTAGEALLEAGDRSAAIRAIEAILTLNPPNIEEYQSLLIQLRGEKEPE
jgi:tetratricopeptide (TPR) repeat protein